MPNGQTLKKAQKITMKAHILNKFKATIAPTFSNQIKGGDNIMKGVWKIRALKIVSHQKSRNHN